MKIKKKQQMNVSIPVDALLNLPAGKFVGFQYTPIKGRSTPTILWTFSDTYRCLRTGCFDFNGNYLGELENES